MLCINTQNKLNTRAKEMRYLRSDNGSSGYRIYNSQNKKILIEQNIVFLKQEEPIKEIQRFEFEIPLELALEDLGTRKKIPTRRK